MEKGTDACPLFGGGTYLASGALASVIPRSVSTLGFASSSASMLWQALQSCVMTAPLFAV